MPMPATSVDDRDPDAVRVDLDPAGLREDAVDGALGLEDLFPIRIDQNGAGRGRALVDRKDVFLFHSHAL